MNDGQSAQPKSLCVIAPLCCEEDLIVEFHSRLKAALEGMAPRYRHTILFVNDGSTDSSLDLLADIAGADRSVRVLSLSRNFGHQIAITAGLDFADGDAAIVMDSDLQDPPEVIPQLVEKWEQGFKVVYGTRSRRKGEGLFKRLSAAIFYRLFRRLSDIELPLDTGDFRLMDRAVVEVLKRVREENRFMRGLIYWVGFRQCGVPYERDPRYAGKTKYTWRRMVRLALNGITSFSDKPLALVSYLGFFVTLLSFLVICWLIYSKLAHPELLIQGWTSLLVVVLFLGGVQLVSLGILGQYIARIFRETKNRPLYVVAETLGFDSEPPTPTSRIRA